VRCEILKSRSLRSPPSAAVAKRRRACGADLEQAWNHPAATTATRKRIVRAVLNEIVVRVDDGHIDLLLHWQGGDHTALKVKKNATGRHRWTVAEETEALIRELARLMPDKTIASLLNGREWWRPVAVMFGQPPSEMLRHR
jgi:hypothetical protein